MNSLLNRFGVRMGALVFAAAVASAGSACTDDDMTDEMGDGDSDTTGGDGDGDSGMLSHAADIQPIWDANCTNGSCHQPMGIPEFPDLSGDAFSDIVGTPSAQAMGSQIVEAGSAQNSYLIAKLRGTQVEFGGSGGRMPSGVGVSPLPEDTIVMIETWIDQGALP